MVDIEQDSVPETSKRQHDPPAASSEESDTSKRNKHEWLAFRGTRHTRVGADFQVTALPIPGSDPQEDNAAESNSPVAEGTGGVGEEPSSRSKDATDDHGTNIGGLPEESSKEGNDDDNDNDDNEGL